MLSSSSNPRDTIISRKHIDILQLERTSGEQVSLKRNLPTITAQDGSGHAPRQRQRE